MRCRPLSLFAIAVVGGALIMACGGGDDEGEQAESDQATAPLQDGAEAAARDVESVSDAGVVEADEPDGTSNPQAQEPPEPPPLEVFEEIDFDSLFGEGLQVVPLGNLESYRYTFAFTSVGTDPRFPGLVELTINSEGKSVGARLHATCTGSLFGLAIDEEVIIIGEQAWIRSGLNGGGFMMGRPRLCTPDRTPAGFGTANLLDTYEQLPGEGTAETVNGVDTVHFTLDETALAELGGIGDALGDFDSDDILEDLMFTLDAWLAEDGGWLVKIEIAGESSNAEGGFFSTVMSLEVFDINSGDIRIEAP